MDYIYISGIFDYGQTINDYITIDEDGLDIAEELGVGLIKYDHRVNKILDNMLSTIDERNINNTMSFNLMLNDDLQINSINRYLTDIQSSMDPRERPTDRFGKINLYTRDLTGYYDTREYAKQTMKDWRPSYNRQQSFIEEKDINTMLETFMPKILSMANSGIPNNIQFSGQSLPVSRSPFGPQNFHQDIDQLAFIKFSHS